MPSTHPFPLSLVALLIAATCLFATVRPAALQTTTDPGVSGPLPRPLPDAALRPRGGDTPDCHAQWNPHASWPGHGDDNDDGTYCGAVTKVFVTAEAGPLASDCEAIRAWAADDANRGYFHASMARLNAAPWVRLVSAGSCAVAVGTDYHEAYRDGLVVGAADVAALLGRLLGDYAAAADDNLAWQGAWAHCASPAYRGDALAAWPAQFRIARAEDVV